MGILTLLRKTNKTLRVFLTLIRQPGSFSALALFLFGLTLLLLQPFDNSSRYIPMAEIASATVWGAGFALIGLTRLITFICDYWFANGHVIPWLFWVEVVSSAGTVAAFFVIFYMFAQGALNTAIPVYFLFLLSAFVDFLDTTHILESGDLKKKLIQS